jgi:DNA (cytosine-5)-methyltransferase 1
VSAQAAISASAPVTAEPPETFVAVGGRLIRRVALRSGATVDTDFGPLPAMDEDFAAVAEARLLRLEEAPVLRGARSFTAADLFCGAGALSAGFLEAARALGAVGRLALAADDAPDPLAVYAESLPCDPGATRQVDLAAVLDGELGSPPTEAERAFLHDVPTTIDVCLAGPPCQGHSSLNNHTRHDDERNDLYLRVVRFVELRRPRFCFIENVQSVKRDQRRSVERAMDHLKTELGYAVDDGVVPLKDIGVPQTRRRHVVVASAPGEPELDLAAAVRRHSIAAPRTVRWAIKDLLDATAEGFDAASVPSAENAERMAWLQRTGKTDLPNPLRPKCHREPKRRDDGTAKEHTYKSMYGRLSWDEPAQTITSGYGSMGQGRYVHPARPRTLTPHEAARLQLFPDYFDFSRVTRRGSWAKMVGNAAPMKLSYVLTLEALR